MTESGPHPNPPYEEPSDAQVTYYGVIDGTIRHEYFETSAGSSWLWIDEQIAADVEPSDEEKKKLVLQGRHRPENYAGHEINVGEQPTILTAPHHDHLIIPDLDLKTDQNQLVSIIVRTSRIETRHAGAVPLLTDVRNDPTFMERVKVERTAAFMFVTIMQMPVDQLDKGLRNIAEKVAEIERDLDGDSPDYEQVRKKWREARRDLARHEKLYDAFKRVADNLFDVRHGAFSERPRAVQRLVERETQRHFSRLRDQIDRALGRAQQLREMLASQDGAIVTRQADQLNKLLALLTVASAASIPLVFVTGAFGMNVKFPGHGEWLGLLLVFLVMIVFTAPVWYVLARWVRRMWPRTFDQRLPRFGKWLAEREATPLTTHPPPAPRSAGSPSRSDGSGRSG